MGRRCGRRTRPPSQIAILNDEFRPSPDEIDHARRVLAAYDEALVAGVRAVTVDGRMIDVPIVERARLLLEGERRSPLAKPRRTPPRPVSFPPALPTRSG
jgi:citrate lyase beta subunit